jgi:hypothetical protein
MVFAMCRYQDRGFVRAVLTCPIRAGTVDGACGEFYHERRCEHRCTNTDVGVARTSGLM